MTHGFVMLPREVSLKMKDLQPLDYKLLMTVITNCIYIDQYEHNGLILNKGEWFRSLSKIQEDLSYIENSQIVTPSIKKIRCILARLQGQGFLTYKGMNKGMNKGMVIKLDEPLIQVLFPTSENETRAKTTTRTTTEKVIVLGQQNNKVLNNNNKDLNNKELKITNKQNSGSNFAEAFLLSYGRHPSPLQIQEFLQYIEDGMQESLICYAIQLSAKVTNNIKYLWGVLGNWTKQGIKTLESAMTEDKKQSKQVQEDDRQKTLDRLYDKYSDLNW